MHAVNGARTRGGAACDDRIEVQRVAIAGKRREAQLIVAGPTPPCERIFHARVLYAVLAEFPDRAA
jgi:hypothetical protein